jgi:thiol-disulfide isomerase/thioredoxin
MRINLRNLTVLFALLMIIRPLAAAQDINYLKIPELEKILNNSDNKVYVINFWATWCAPCVSEIPGFEEVSKGYDKKKVRFVMVSLDFPSQIEKQLIPFLKKNKITLDVFVMTDLDYNAWIDKVDPSWQGDIPATLFINNQKKTRLFHSGVVTGPDLKKYINSML